MPWYWVGVVLVLWTVGTVAVIALCVSVRQIDTRLGRVRRGVRYAKQAEPRPGTGAKVE
jgi:hypothetical protein